MRDVRIRTNETHGYPDIERVKLTSNLTGSSADAVRRNFDGSNYADTTEAITVHDPLGSFTGASTGDKFWAIRRHDSRRWELLGPSTSQSSYQFVLFQLTGTLTTADATQTADVVIAYGDGALPDGETPGPADSITVRNPETESPGVYAYAQDNGKRGWALWNGTDWSIIAVFKEAGFNAQVEFYCNQTVTTSDASFAAKITRLICDASNLGVAVDDEITIYNRATTVADTYVFTGTNLTGVGLAQWDTVLEQWDVIWITCP